MAESNLYLGGFSDKPGPIGDEFRKNDQKQLIPGHPLTINDQLNVDATRMSQLDHTSTKSPGPSWISTI